MSWCNRRWILTAPLAVAACGFEPVYGPQTAAMALYGSVRVDAPETPDAFVLVRELEQRLGRSTTPAFQLSYVLVTQDDGQAVTESGDITRFSLVGVVDYTLRSVDSGTIVASGTVDNFTGYSATGSTVETLAAERDAHERLMIILAEQIATRLNATAWLDT